MNQRPYLPVKSNRATESIKVVPFDIDTNYLSDLDFTLVAGRNFSQKFSTDSTQALILNETAVRRLGFKNNHDAIGQPVKVGEKSEMLIVGIVQDFHYTRLQRAIQPVILRYNPNRFFYSMIRIQPGDLINTVDEIESAWNRVNPAQQSLRYRFLDDYVQGAYNDARDIVTFLGIIAGLAIFLACLGLLGMAIYNAETRTKEIGIRKVFGASVAKIVMLVSKDLVKLLFIAAAIAATLSTLFITQVFMVQFPYTTDIGLGIFLLAISLVGLLALITIGSQSVKAAMADPAVTLREE